MKVVINILHTVKYTDRIERLASGGIRSKDHSVKVRILADGPRPHNAPQSWEWIHWPDVRWQDRLARLFVTNVLEADADYYYFGDDDVLIDVDGMVRTLGMTNETQEPVMWGCSPITGICHESWWEMLIADAGHLITKPRESLYIEYCSTVMNNRLVTTARNSPQAHAMYAWSQKLHAGDIQLPTLGWMFDAKYVHGSKCKSLQFPSFHDSSVLCSEGDKWHIHGVRNCEMTSHETLMRMIDASPRSREKLTEAMYPELQFGIDVKEVIGQPFMIGYFYAHWLAPMYRETFGTDTSLSASAHSSDRGTMLWGAEIVSWRTIGGGFEVDTPQGPLQFLWRAGRNLVGIFKNSDDMFVRGTVRALWFDEDA